MSPVDPAAGREPDRFAPLAPPLAPVSYTVKPGDTLFGIAAKLGVADDQLSGWVSQVVKLNSMDSANALAAGQQLQLPDLGAKPTAPAGPTTNVFSGSAGSIGYTVQPGDTLSTIGAGSVAADRLGDWTAAVLQLNGLAGADAIQVGQLIRLPAIAAGASPAAPAAATASTPTRAADPKPSLQTASYTVLAGDTLGALGGKSGVSDDGLSGWIAQVVQINALASADALQAGATIQVPVTNRSVATSATAVSTSPAAAPAKPDQPSFAYTVRSGDTLSDIAGSQGIASSKLSAWLDSVATLNSMSSSDTLFVGQKLLLPGTPASTAVSPTSTSYPAAVPVPTLASTTPAATQNVGAASTGGTVTPAASGAATNASESDSIKNLPAAAQTNGTTRTSPSLLATSGSCYYTVQSGDTWDTIARAAGVLPSILKPWSAAVAAMNNVDPSVLPVGDGLRLPC